MNEIPVLDLPQLCKAAMKSGIQSVAAAQGCIVAPPPNGRQLRQHPLRALCKRTAVNQLEHKLISLF